jgi:uncharacterized protein (DUF2249 family)
MTAVIPRGVDLGHDGRSVGPDPAARMERGMTTTASPPQEIDIRLLGTCTDRKAHVLNVFDTLEVGRSVVVVNDHLPNGLLRHFDERRPGGFDWALIESGPDVFRVLITKTSAV